MPGAVAWNLFDIDAKFGDVESVDDICRKLDEIGAAQGEPTVQPGPDLVLDLVGRAVEAHRRTEVRFAGDGAFGIESVV